MPLSMHDAVPALARSLKNLDAILDKAAAYAEARKIDPAVLLASRLAPDMAPLTRQVQMASDGAKGMARLAQVEVLSFPDTETSFPELKARLEKTVAFLESLPAAGFEGAETRTIVMKFPNREMSFPALAYLYGFVLPNVYFHLTTAYAILRHNGLEIGKMDYLGGV